MARLQVVASQALSGKSTIAAALSLALARAGENVTLLRSGSDEGAAPDARAFATLSSVNSNAQPVAIATLPPSYQGLLVLEPEAGAAPLPGASALLVARGPVSEGDLALARSIGERLLGSIAVAVLPSQVEARARELTDSGLRPLALLPEDRALTAPSVGEIRGVLDAALLWDGDNGDDVVEEVLIAPVYSDPAQPVFHRFTSKAILAPYNKTDLLLAAIESQPACLVITGGGRPSPYVIDRVQSEPTTVLLAPTETPQTLNALGEVWRLSRFQGERKAQVALGLLSSRLDIAAFARRIGD